TPAPPGRFTMRTTLAFGLLLGVAGGSIAADPSDVIDRAVRATAGTSANLQKRKAFVFQAKGLMVLPGVGEVPAVRECTAALPDRIKWVAELSPMGTKMPVVVVINGVKGWQMIYGAAQEMRPPVYDSVQDETHFMWICPLIPLQGGKLPLAALPDATVHGKPAFGVRVTTK